MLGHLLAVLGLGLLCGVWVLLQRWIAHRDPDIGLRVEEHGSGCGVCDDAEQRGSSGSSCSGACQE